MALTEKQKLTTRWCAKHLTFHWISFCIWKKAHRMTWTVKRLLWGADIFGPIGHMAPVWPYNHDRKSLTILQPPLGLNWDTSGLEYATNTVIRNRDIHIGYACTQAHARRHTHTNACTLYTYTHTRIHTHTRACTHTRTHLQFKSLESQRNFPCFSNHTIEFSVKKKPEIDQKYNVDIVNVVND